METNNILKVFQWVLAFVVLHATFGDDKCQEPINTECRKYDKVHFNDRIRVNSSRYNIDFICDTKTDGGGWIIFQRRFNKFPSFEKSWEEYQQGFGDVCKDYWLGNENLHKITSKGLGWELRIDMIYENSSYYALYSDFYIAGKKELYKLTFNKFLDGNAGDMMTYHNGMNFSAPNVDNDATKRTHCAQKYRAGWWYGHCFKANLNGIFDSTEKYHSVGWMNLTHKYGSLTAVEMKIREMTQDFGVTQPILNISNLLKIFNWQDLVTNTPQESFNDKSKADETKSAIPLCIICHPFYRNKFVRIGR